MSGFFLKLKELFSQKTRHCGRGTLVVAVLLALCGMQVWGENYQWDGTAGDGDWENPTNWNPNTGFPQVGDNVTIRYSTNPLTFTQTINVASLLIDAQNLVTFTGAVNTGTLYVHGRSSLDFAADLTVTDFYVYANYGVDNVPITISGGSASIGSYNYYVNGQGTLTDASTITVASGASLDIGSGTIPTLVNNGTVTATGSVTVNDYSGSGSNTGLTILSGGGGTPATYYWIGGSSNDWKDAANWSNTEPTVLNPNPAAATDYPQSGDTAYFKVPETNDLTFSFSDTINVAKIEVFRPTADSGSTATTSISFTGNVTTTDFIVHTGVAVDFSGNSNITNIISQAGGANPSTSVTISGGTTTINNYTDTASNYCALNISGGTLEVAAGSSITFANIANNGTLKNNGEITLKGYSGNGTIENTSGSALKINSTTAVTIDSITNGGTIQNNSTGNVTITALNANGGTVENKNSGELAITTLTMTADCEVKNSGSGITIGTLDGAHTATLNNAASGSSITVSGYGTTVPTIIADAGTINLKAGTIESLTVNSSTTIIQGSLETVGNVKLTNTSDSVLQSNGDGSATLVVDGNLEINGSVGYGGAFGSVTVEGSTTIVAEDTTHKPCLKTAGDVTLNTFINSGSIDVGGTLTVNGTTTNYAGASISTTGDQTYNDKVTVSGTVVNTVITFTGDTITFNDDLEIAAANTTTTATIEFKATTETVAKDIIVTSGAETTAITSTNIIEATSFTYSPTDAAKTLTITTPTGSQSSFGDFTATTNTGNANINITGKNEFNDFTTNIVLSIVLDGENTIKGDFTARGNSRITLNGNNEFIGDFKFLADTTSSTPYTSQVTLGGTNTFNNFTFSNGDSLTVNAAQTVTGTLSLSGKSASNKLAVTGSGGSFVVSSDQTAQFLSVNRDNVKITGGKVCTAYNSEKTDSATDPEPYNGWTIEAGNQTIIWTGATDTAWANAANWKPQVVPGTGGSANCDVLIPTQYDDGTGTNITVPQFPIAAAAYIVNKIEIANGASVTIDSGANVTFSEIVNEGELITNADFEITKYGGSGSIENSAVLEIKPASDFAITKITNSSSGTVRAVGVLNGSNYNTLTITELSNAGTVENTNYGNLTITEFKMTADSVVNNVGKTTIGKLSGAFTASLKRETNGSITVQDYEDSPSIEVSGTEIFLAGGTIASLTVNEGLNSSSYTIANLTDDLEVTGDVTLQAENSIIQSSSAASLVVNGNVNNAGKIGNGAAVLASLEVTGTTNNAGQIETTGNQKYTGAVTNSGTMVVPAQLTLGSSFTNTGTYTGANSEIIATTTSSGGIINFGTTGINAKSFTYSPTGAANLVINGKATFTGDFIASTVGNAALIFNGTTSFKDFSFTGSSTTLTVNAAQTVTGTLTLSGVDESNPLTIAGDGQFNLSSEQTTKHLVVGTYVKICDSAGTALADGAYLCKVLYSKYSDGTTGVKNGWCIVGDTITWTGGAGTTAWTTSGNWDVGIVPGIDDSGSGGEDTTIYKVVIPVKYNGSNIGDYPVAAAAYTVKDLTIGGDETISDSMAGGVPSVTLGSDNITVTGTFENYGKIIYSGAGRITHSGSAINDVDNKGTVEYTTGAATLTDFGTTDYYNLIINANVSFSGSSLSVSNNFTIESSGKYTATGSKITIGGNFENNGTFSDGTAEITVTGILNDDNSAIKFAGGTNGVTAKEFKYEPTNSAGAKLEISGANTFTDFTASSLGGATLIIKGTQTVTNLTLSGDSTASLTIDGDTNGSFNITTDQEPGEFLLIERDKVSICDGNDNTTPYFYATNSSYNSSTPSEQYGLHKRWFILNENMEFIWKGTDSTSPTEWNEKSNWNLGMVPGLDKDANSTGNPPIDTLYYNVLIPDGCPEWPVVSGEYNIKNLTIGTETNSTHDAKLEIASGGNLILSDNSSAAAILTNYGTIVYSDESRINDGTNSMNDAANGGTVQYIGADVVTLTDFASDDGNDYANLIINSTVNSSFGAAGKNIVVAGKAEINVSEIEVKSFTFKGDVEDNVDSTVNGSVFIFGNGNAITTSGPTTTFTIRDDLILLGKKYNIDDKQDSLQSQVEGLFAYNHTSRKSTASCTDYFPSDAIAACNGNPLTVASGSTITVGKNFYANGVEITGGGTWNLVIPNNDSQTSAFAELYNSSITNCNVTGGFVSAAEKGSTNTVTGCTGVETKRPFIKEAYTVYDDVIFVSFKYEDDSDVVIENSENEISAAAANIFHKVGENANVAFAGTYIDADCTTSTNGRGDITSSFYIKTANKWNTDATGISAGSSESTDRRGEHRTVVPYLNLPKALNTLYETLRDKYKNRISHYYSASPNLSAMSDSVGKTYTKVEDKCAPVLVSVYTGQEMHTSDVSQQKDYDAHNFIEYCYSEPVAIGDGTIAVDVSDVNIQATAGLGAVTNNDTGFTMAGLGIFSDGKIDASLRPEKTGEPHSFYRNFSLQPGGEAVNHSCRIRVSIAGFVDGVVDGGYKNWTGYISSAICPRTGVATVLPDANLNITDLATDALGNPKNNALDSTGAINHPIVPITVNKELVDAGVSNLNLYGTWDVTPPSFAPMRTNEMATWERPATDGTAEYEIVGMSYSEGMLSAVEFHMFDNEPTYNETLQWFSRIGWAEVNPSEPTEYDEIISYAADIIGGSRPYSSSNTTSGGIRYSSVYDSKDAFVYSANETEFKNFSGVQQFAQSSFFKYIGGDKNPIDTNDGHYLSLALDPSDTMLTGETNFVIKFDSSACFITDLAGNRIQCGNITMKSIDRAPPTFNISAVPLGNKKMLIVFAKAVAVENIELYTNAHSKQTVSALENIPKSLVLKDADGNSTDIQITNEPAQCVFRSKKATGIVVTLNRDATLNDVVNGTYITVENGGTRWYDPLCGTMGEVTYIQDEIGNFIRVGKQHTFSDFAVDAVQMQYAYPILDHSLDKYDLNQGTFIIRDWNAEQERSGYINENKEIILHGALYDGTNNNTGGLNEMLQDASNSVTAYFDASPSGNSVGDKINNLMQGERTWRIWLPSTQNDIFENFASENNVAEFSLDGEIAKATKTTERRFINFDVPEEVSTEKWKAGDQVEFLFKLGNYEIRHNGPDEDPQPLYCLRLKDSSDLTSLDLWSFKMKEVTLQRGGVTILANVINVNAKEKTTVQVDVQETGNLSVMVMTLDGNIVKYLHHGKAEKGTHYYLWDGTNKGGSPVARGLYFVRVIGPGIDETRKVMCVKK